MMNTTDDQARPVEILAGMVGETIRAAGTRTLLSEVARDLITTWARKGGVRKNVSSPALWLLSKVLSPERNGNGNGISADAGRLLTAWAKQVNTQHAGDPTCHAQTRGDSIHAFLKNTDFGEIREMVESSGPCVLKTVEAFNEQLWKYPAKVGSLVATVIPLLNIFILSFREILRPIEKSIGPDLFADIMLSVVKGINGADMAKLLNTLQELVRRIHTGSLLLGKGGRPLFQIYLTDLLRDTLAGLDPELVRKVRIILAEDKEVIANAMADALRDNQALTLSAISSLGSEKTSVIKAETRKLGVIEDVDLDGLKTAVSESASNLDTYEVAGFINTICRVVNRVHDANPDVLSSLLGQVADSVDPEEVKKTVSWLIPEIVEAVKPLASAVMPSLLIGLSALVSPEAGFESAEHRDALKIFAAALEAGDRG
ncbi:MAG: hypothetical protein RRA35_00745 [Desulfomonilia bacterium]|nr:hypothetical protein [Desulfomonilia bacterium]